MTKSMRGRAADEPLRILDACSLVVAEGRTIGLEGRERCGQEVTLVRILLGLIPADGGAVLWEGVI